MRRGILNPRDYGEIGAIDALRVGPPPVKRPSGARPRGTRLRVAKQIPYARINVPEVKRDAERLVPRRNAERRSAGTAEELSHNHCMARYAVSPRVVNRALDKRDMEDTSCARLAIHPLPDACGDGN